MIRETPAGLARRALKVLARVLLLLAGLEALVPATVEAFETVRRGLFWVQPPKEGFPWEEQPEMELESGGGHASEHIKLYPDASAKASLGSPTATRSSAPSRVPMPGRLTRISASG